MADPSRRSLLKWCTHCLGALFAAILGALALAYLIDARHRKTQESAFRLVQGVKVSDLKEINQPVQGVIRAIRHDAWTLYPNDVIGRVWVVRTKEGAGADCFQVYTTVCPHLGCSINLITGTPPFFKCPCHEAEFQCDGTRIERAGYTNAAPRGMDSLDFKFAGRPGFIDGSLPDILPDAANQRR